MGAKNFWFGKKRPDFARKIKGLKRTDEQRRNISLSKKGRPNGLLGRKIPPDVRLKMSLARKGIKLSEQTRKNMGLARKGKPNFKARGQKRTPEQIQRMIEAHRNTPKGENSKKWKGGYQNRLWNNRKRRVRLLGNGGGHTLDEWVNMKAQYNWTCPRCLRREPDIKLTVDHIIPLVKGGSHNIENIQPLCRICNSSKNKNTIKYNKPIC